jgi:hypothetical protein
MTKNISCVLGNRVVLGERSVPCRTRGVGT